MDSMQKSEDELPDITTPETSVEQLKTSIQVHEKHNDHVNAAVKGIELLMLLYENESQPEHHTDFSLCQKTILKNGSKITQLPNNYGDQGILTRLYILGCSLYRNEHYSASFTTLNAAVSIHDHDAVLSESDVNANGILMMKIYYELAQSGKAQGKIDQCIDHLKRSLSLCLQNNDIIYQTKVLFDLSSMLMSKKLYAEVVEAGLSLLVLKDDLNQTLRDKPARFRSSWPQGGERELHLKLARSYNELRLYDRAMQHLLRYKFLLESSGDDEVTVSKRALTQLELKTVFNMMGDLQMAFGGFESALSAYEEWIGRLSEMKTGSIDQDESRLRDVMVGQLRCGLALMQMLRFDQALLCFTKCYDIARVLRDEKEQIEALIRQAEIRVQKFDMEEAKTLLASAVKLSRLLPEDDAVEFEIKCICVESDMYGKEQRYTHALYHAERAFSLMGTRPLDLRSTVEAKIGKYAQHSTSVKELHRGLAILLRNLHSLEAEISRLRAEQVSCLHEQEALLDDYYKSAQVTLHRLGELRNSAALAECRNRRRSIRARNRLPQLPLMCIEGLKQPSGAGPEEHAVDWKDADGLLAACDGQTVLMYTPCDCGYLAHLVSKEDGHTTVHTHLLSSSTAKPLNVLERARQLKQVCRGRSMEADEFVCSLYNTENRSIPNECQAGTTKGLISRVDSLNADDSIDGVGGGGDAGGVAKHDNVLPVGKEPAATPERDENRSGVDGKENQPDAALATLFNIFVQPFYEQLYQLPHHSPVCFITNDSCLDWIPFDQLIDSRDGCNVGERFRVSVAPCLLVLENKCQVTSAPPGGTSSATDEDAYSRDRELAAMYTEAELASLRSLRLDKSISGLVTATATGTRIMTSSRYTTPYRQVVQPLQSCVIGSPAFGTCSLKLNDQVTWSSPPKLSASLVQCNRVSKYLDVTPITGKLATKSRFLDEIEKATVIHISTFACLTRGTFAFAPDPCPVEEAAIPAESFLVTAADLIRRRPFQVQLAVLSCGHGWQNSSDSKFALPHALLDAGVQSVLFARWPVPDSILNTFFHNFYMSLQNSDDGFVSVSRALHDAKTATKTRHADAQFWNAFTLLGRDVRVNLTEIRAAQTHKLISESEKDALMPAPVIGEGMSPADNMHALQSAVGRMCSVLNGSSDVDVVAFLIGLTEEATERLARDDNVDRPIILAPGAVLGKRGSIDLLHLLGFDFQAIDQRDAVHHAAGGDGGQMMVVFPHWNQDGLLLPAHRVLTGLYELCGSQDCLRSLSKMLPLTQDDLCSLIDLLALLRHTPGVQLRISDTSVQQLWRNVEVRRFLRAIGLLDVRDLLVFQRSFKHRTLLIGTLQLLVSLSLHRDHGLLDSLNVASLGRKPEMTSRPAADQLESLSSLQAMVMPRHEIALSSSWMESSAKDTEVKRRKKLADDIRETGARYERLIDHAKWWHRDITLPRAQPTTSRVTSSSPRALRRVKVKSGASPSCDRVAVDRGQEEDGADDGGWATGRGSRLHVTLRRREESRAIVRRRCEDLSRRHAVAVRGFYLPFVVTGSDGDCGK